MAAAASGDSIVRVTTIPGSTTPVVSGSNGRVSVCSSVIEVHPLRVLVPVGTTARARPFRVRMITDFREMPTLSEPRLQMAAAGPLTGVSAPAPCDQGVRAPVSATPPQRRAGPCVFRDGASGRGRGIIWASRPPSAEREREVHDAGSCPVPGCRGRRGRGAADDPRDRGRSHRARAGRVRHAPGRLLAPRTQRALAVPAAGRRAVRLDRRDQRRHLGGPVHRRRRGASRRSSTSTSSPTRRSPGTTRPWTPRP